MARIRWHGHTDGGGVISFPVSGISWTRVRVPRVLSTIFLVVYGLTAIIGGLGGLLDAPLAFVAPAMVSPITWLLLILSYILSLTSSWAPGHVDVTGEELAVMPKGSSARKVSRTVIVGALVVERAVGDGHVSTVEIELEDGDRLTVRLHDPSQARALVEALGYGQRGARLRVRLATPTRRLLHLIAGGVAWAISWIASMLLVGAIRSIVSDAILVAVGMSSALSSLAGLGIYVLLRRALRPPEVVLGDEGSTVTRGFRRRFFRPGEIGLASALSGRLLDRPRLAALLAAENQRTTVAAVNAERLAEFERGGRPLDLWRNELRRKLDDSSYRSTATTIDDAAAALRSPFATPEQRLGAALALRIAGEPPSRIRVAVAASIDEDIRLALEAAASDDDPAIERALRRMR